MKKVTLTSILIFVVLLSNAQFSFKELNSALSKDVKNENERSVIKIILPVKNLSEESIIKELDDEIQKKKKLKYSTKNWTVL
jgi:hypothetical protein